MDAAVAVDLPLNAVPGHACPLGGWFLTINRVMIDVFPTLWSPRKTSLYFARPAAPPFSPPAGPFVAILAPNVGTVGTHRLLEHRLASLDHHPLFISHHPLLIIN